MIRKIEIENFKSVKKLELELGRLTVLIGENGAGKSNILEAIAFAGAADANKLDYEFLFSRGVRMTDDPRLMLPRFISPGAADSSTVKVLISDDFHRRRNFEISTSSNDTIRLLNPNRTQWSFASIDEVKLQNSDDFVVTFSPGIIHRLKKLGVSFSPDDEKMILEYELPEYIKEIHQFLVFAPENRELRKFSEEGQILPLGIHGEGLFRLLKILGQQDDGAKLATLKEKLQLIDWFEDFEFQKDAMAYERRLLIRDRHLSDDLAYFDQRSANEGFLFLLFYFCLFLSDATPPFFAIDNIDSSLNPRLCARLMHELVKMAADNGKQAIVTTHNPAVLDGLDLNDDEQRLYVVRRDLDGETIVNRVHPPKVMNGRSPVPLSEAFLRGYIGGLPENF